MIFLIKALEVGKIDNTYYIVPSDKQQLLEKLLEVKTKNGKTLAELVKELFGEDPVVGEVYFHIYSLEDKKLTTGYATIIETTMSDIYTDEQVEGSYYLLIPYKAIFVGQTFELVPEKVVVQVDTKKTVDANLVSNLYDKLFGKKEEKKEVEKPSPGVSKIQEILTHLGFTVSQKENIFLGKKIINGVPVYIAVYESVLNEHTASDFLGKLALIGLTPALKIFVAAKIEDELTRESLVKNNVIVVSNPQSLIDVLYSFSGAKEKINYLSKAVEILVTKNKELERTLNDIKRILENLRNAVRIN